jgi:hypothetical protein
MAKSTIVDINKQKKRRPGRPVTGIGPIIAVRLYPDQSAKLDTWIAQQTDAPSRPEAIRRLLAKALGKVRKEPPP